MMEQFVDFMTGKYGRALRIIVGVVLLVLAALVFSGTTQFVAAAVGVLLGVSGLLKVCIFNKLVGRPLNACPVDR